MVVHNLGALLEEVLQSTPDSGRGGFLIRLVGGVIIGLFLGLVNSFYGSSLMEYPFGYMLVGISVVLLTWGGDRLWGETVGPMIQWPSALSLYLLRTPVWWLAGGIGYSFAALIAKKWGLLIVYDLPVKPLFAMGGKLGLLLQLINQILMYRIVQSRFPILGEKRNV